MRARIINGNGLPPAVRPTAFSSKVDTGSRQENAIKQRSRVLSDSAESEDTPRDCLKKQKQVLFEQWKQKKIRWPSAG
jgi:hypothetical protein